MQSPSNANEGNDIMNLITHTSLNKYAKKFTVIWFLKKRQKTEYRKSGRVKLVK